MAEEQGLRSSGGSRTWEAGGARSETVDRGGREGTQETPRFRTSHLLGDALNLIPFNYSLTTHFL